MCFLRSAPTPTSRVREAEIFLPGYYLRQAWRRAGQTHAREVLGRPFGAGGQVHEEGPSYEVGASSGAILGAGPASGSGVKGDQVLGGLDEVRGVEPNGGRGSDLGR